jgi:hypothetical protein
MKKMFTLFLLFCTFMLTAQTEMRWDPHGIGFRVPSDFRVETNNGEEYTASNANMSLTMAPVQDEKVTEDHLADAVIEMAKEMSYNVVSDADHYANGDLVGYYVEGKKAGMNAVVMAVLDTESSTNLIIVVTYDDRSRDQAIEMIHSIFAYD